VEERLSKQKQRAKVTASQEESKHPLDIDLATVGSFLIRPDCVAECMLPDVLTSH